jgi:SpoIID/LytB domain protein
MTVALLAWAPSAAPGAPEVDETSSSDKLRILYSHRFTFTDDGLPLVTIEIMGGQSEVRLSSRGGVTALPDGEGGAQVAAGERWLVTVDSASPAQVREWTIVDRIDPDDEAAVERSAEMWRARGLAIERFEVGTLFGVEGEVIDSRRVLIGVAPEPEGKGAARARQIARKYELETEVHREIVRRPGGTIVARSGGTVVRNPSVIWFAPPGGGTIEVADVVAGSGGSQLATRREDRRYFGLVYVTVGRDGKLVVANAVTSEQLLAGLVPSEMFPTAPLEALKAQAIAARTDLLEKIGTRHFGDPYLVCSTQHCQVYSGAGKEQARTTRAVRETRGLVLLRDSGGLGDARYSASCGGHGEHKHSVWGGGSDPTLTGRPDAAKDSPLARRYDQITDDNIDQFLAETGGAYCSTTKYSADRFRWEERIDAAKLDALVAQSYPSIGRLLALEPIARGVSGRIQKLRIRGDRATEIARGDLHIRRLLGGLRSSLFTVKAAGPSDRPIAFVFRGAGFGHGVGMCQLGAIGMAEKRNGFREILNHYYPATHLHRLY